MRSDINPNLFPSCDGRPLDIVPRAEPWLAAKRKFLEAYHQINVQYSKLRALRLGRSHPDAGKERKQLQAIDRALLVKEALEDYWAARGLVAIPEQVGGFTVNVGFAYPGRPASRAAGVGSSTAITLSFASPGTFRSAR